jgi:hypothetical protein
MAEQSSLTGKWTVSPSSINIQWPPSGLLGQGDHRQNSPSITRQDTRHVRMSFFARRTDREVCRQAVTRARQGWKIELGGSA